MRLYGVQLKCAVPPPMEPACGACFPARHAGCFSLARPLEFGLPLAHSRQVQWTVLRVGHAHAEFPLPLTLRDLE